MRTVAKLKLVATDRGHGVQLDGVGTPDCGGVQKGQARPYGGTKLAIARARFRPRGVGLGASFGSADQLDSSCAQGAEGGVSNLPNGALALASGFVRDGQPPH
jgi:hypothetical protein